MTLDHSLAELARHSQLPPRGLPSSCYLDPDYWKAEQERVLRAGWHAVARVHELCEVGDFRSVDLLGESVLLLRDDSRRLRAFSRVCLHRASVIVEGEGSAKRFTCPYHRWSYDLDGRLCAAPLMEDVAGFQRAKHRLHEFAVEEWLGFVLVSLAAEPTPLAPQVEEIAEVFSSLDLASYRRVGTMDYDSAWNWKVLVENFIESYHHLGTHAKTAQPTLPAEATYLMDVPGEGALLDNPGINGAPGVWVGLIFPKLLFFVSQSEDFPFAVWYELQIDAIDHFHLRIHLLLPPESATNEDLIKWMLDEFIDVFHREDIEQCRLVQHGLSSRAFQPTALATQEDGVVRFHRFLAERMGSDSP